MLTDEQRLDRLEQIAKLFVRAGLRARSNLRDLDEKFAMLVSAQLANEERFARLAESQTHTDRQLDALIDIVREERNGNSKRRSLY